MPFGTVNSVLPEIDAAKSDKIHSVKYSYSYCNFILLFCQCSLNGKRTNKTGIFILRPIHYASFDLFLAIASSTARNCFRSSSRLDFLLSLSEGVECAGEASAETPTAAGFFSSIVIGDLFFGGSTKKRKFIQKFVRYFWVFYNAIK